MKNASIGSMTMTQHLDFPSILFISFGTPFLLWRIVPTTVIFLSNNFLARGMLVYKLSNVILLPWRSCCSLCGDQSGTKQNGAEPGETSLLFGETSLVSTNCRSPNSTTTQQQFNLSLTFFGVDTKIDLHTTSPPHHPHKLNVSNISVIDPILMKL